MSYNIFVYFDKRSGRILWKILMSEQLNFYVIINRRRPSFLIHSDNDCFCTSVKSSHNFKRLLRAKIRHRPIHCFQFRKFKDKTKVKFRCNLILTFWYNVHCTYSSSSSCHYPTLGGVGTICIFLSLSPISRDFPTHLPSQYILAHK